MGADAFYVFYGVRFSVASERELQALETGSDARAKAARAAKLRICFDRLTDGAPYFLLIGHELGTFGAESLSDASFAKDELIHLMSRTEAQLKSAGFSEHPKMYFQFAAQY